jgi:hypothetical protein
VPIENIDDCFPYLALYVRIEDMKTAEKMACSFDYPPGINF